MIMNYMLLIITMMHQFNFRPLHQSIGNMEETKNVKSDF
jgi:hypothetical protein